MIFLVFLAFCCASSRLAIKVMTLTIISNLKGVYGIHPETVVSRADMTILFLVEAFVILIIPCEEIRMFG